MNRVRRFGVMLLAIGCWLGSVSFGNSISVPPEWIEAYEQGRRDEREKIVKELRKVEQVLLAVLKYKKLLLGGLIPPPLVVDTYTIRREGGGMEIQRTTKIINPASIDFTALNRLKVDLTKGVKLQSGWWVYIDVAEFADYEIGYLKHQLKKLGFEPVIWKGILIVKVEDKEASAEKTAERVSRHLSVNAEVARVSTITESEEEHED